MEKKQKKVMQEAFLLTPEKQKKVMQEVVLVTQEKYNNNKTYLWFFSSKSIQKIKSWIKQNKKKTIFFSGCGLIYVVGIIVFCRIQSSLLYYPNQGYGKLNRDNPFHLQHPRNRNLVTDDLQIQTIDGVILKGWHIQKQQAKRMIVYFQGNAGNIGSRLFYVENLMHQLKSDIIIVAYRGYSDNQQTKISQKGLKLDAQAILQEAKKRAQRKKIPLYVMGTSLGGAVATYVSGLQVNKNKINGLILQNTFTSTTDVIRTLVPRILSPIVTHIGLFNFNSWNSLGNIHKVKGPILFIKGMRDNLVKPQLMNQLRNECNKNHIENYVLQIRDGGHNDVWFVDRNTYFTQIKQFFSSIERAKL